MRFRSDGSFPGGILSSTRRLYSLDRTVFDEADWLGRQLRSKQVDQVHLTASERVAYPRTGDVTLRPGARVDGAVVASVDVVVQAVDVVLVEHERASTSTLRSAVHQRRPVVGL